MQLMRLHQPIGMWLVFYPAAWALAFAQPAALDGALLGLLFVGAVLMRSAGCIANDLADRRFDGAVARTAARPLVTGAISPRHALYWLALLLTLSFGLTFLLPYPTQFLALLVAPLVIAYPFMKRFSWWPQVFLALVFNTSVLFAWQGALGEMQLETTLLYAAAALWTLGYDTLYALQDIDDDARIGVKSSARKLGRLVLPFCALCYMGMIVLLAYIALRFHMGGVFWAGLGVSAVLLGWQIMAVWGRGNALAGTAFRSNQWVGLVVFLSIVADSYALMGGITPR